MGLLSPLVAARREVHAQVIEAVQAVLAEGEGEVARDPRYVVCLAPPPLAPSWRLTFLPILNR